MLIEVFLISPQSESFEAFEVKKIRNSLQSSFMFIVLCPVAALV